MSRVVPAPAPRCPWRALPTRTGRAGNLNLTWPCWGKRPLSAASRQLSASSCRNGCPSLSGKRLLVLTTAALVELHIVLAIGAAHKGKRYRRSRQQSYPALKIQGKSSRALHAVGAAHLTQLAPQPTPHPSMFTNAAGARALPRGCVPPQNRLWSLGRAQVSPSVMAQPRHARFILTLKLCCRAPVWGHVLGSQL